MANYWDSTKALLNESLGKNREGVLARSHGLVFSSAAGGAHWPIAIRCPSLPFPSVKVHQAAVLVRRFCFSMENREGGGRGGCYRWGVRA